VETGEATGILNPLMASFNAAAGLGTGNRGRWSNLQFDTLLDSAYHTFDNARRDTMLQQAAKIASDDVAVIPVLWLAQIWGVRPGFDYAPRTDGYTIAAAVKGTPK
jgi:peptide/nickel transport system substrate-binding protein